MNYIVDIFFVNIYISFWGIKKIFCFKKPIVNQTNNSYFKIDFKYKRTNFYFGMYCRQFEQCNPTALKKKTTFEYI